MDDEEELDDDGSAYSEVEAEDLSPPLIAAAVAGDLNNVRSLLEQGVDKDETTNLGCTAMWHAACKGYVEIVRLLVEQGADKEKIYRGGKTLLFIAADKGHFDIVRILVEQGANKDLQSGKYDETPLFIASESGHLLIVQLLVEQGADMEKCDNQGRSPLYVACRDGHLHVARYLLEKGADRDKACFDSNNNWTPLHIAASNDHLEITKLLMVYGADLNARVSNGQLLPIDVAHDEEIKQAIRDEPRRRMDEAPGKRATEQDRHPNLATSATSLLEEENDEVGHCNKNQRLDEGEAEEGKVAEEDEDSEPSDGEDD